MSTMRIGGLASGLDVDQIVADLMRAERIPLDRLYQDKQILEWQRDDYREMNKLLDDLDETIFNGISKQGTFTAKTITSTNEYAVSAVNINSTTDINTSIRVDQLAEAAYINSSGDIRSDTSFDPDNILADERSKLATDFTSNTFTIQAINSDGTLGDEISFTFDPSTDSLNDILDDINTSNAGVNAFYDEQTGRISISAKYTGDVTGDAEIKVTGDFLTGSLNLAGDNIAAGANGNEGKNAIFNINGIDTERSSNKFRINGFEYNLKQVTDDGDGVTEAGELVTITSQTNTDSIYDSIMDFVNKYNEVIEQINSEISEERYRDYSPLTDEQKGDLTEREVELWEEKARSGMLRNDSILTSGLNQMRIDIYSPISNSSSTFTQLSEIGITTSTNYQDNGKLVVDEAKLRTAIQEDPNSLYELFNKKTTDTDGNIVKNESGIAVRLRQTIDNTMTSIEEKAGNTYKTNSQFSIGQRLDNVSIDILEFEDRLIRTEERYYREFTAMEIAIQEANSQADYLAQLSYM